LHHPADAINLVVRYGKGTVSEAKYADNPRNRENWKPILRIKARKDVTGKEGPLHGLPSV
jgi:hypothetical protein